jgi:hypothetical protein
MRLLFSLLLASLCGTLVGNSTDQIDAVTIAIFLKQRNAGLPLFLACIENQTYPKNKTHLYIQPIGTTSSYELVSAWVDSVKDDYASIHIAECTHSESEIFLNKPADSAEYLTLSGSKRNASLRWAYERKSHYFTCDTDFFCTPTVLCQMLATRLDIVGPMLNSHASYSNFHAAIDDYGYFKNCERYWQILKREVKGIIEVPVVNGVYCIQYCHLPELSYCDESNRYDYVIFSDTARKKDIHQYLDNQADYGIISFAQNMNEISKISGISPLFEVKSRCNLINDYLKIFKPKVSPAQSVFTEIYDKKMWGSNAEGLGWSGGGSSVEATSVYRAFLQDFLKQRQIQSVVDLGCGDWEFSKLIDWGSINYLGLDVVNSVVERNIARYARETVHFRQFDALQNELPAGQLLICKDVLQHLSNEDIIAISPQFKKFKYCLITNGIDPVTLSSDNHDIARGDYRPIDLSKPPFNIPCKRMIIYPVGGFMIQTVLIEN